MWYYYKFDNCFHDEPIEDQACDKEYTDEEYAELFSKVDAFHTVGVPEGGEFPEVILVELETAKNAARKKRKTECFEYINRGQFWYDSLTDDQKTELKEWYNAWLDVTETCEIPTKPEWLI